MARNELAVLRRLQLRRPENRHELAAWVGVFLGMNMPERAMCPHHQSPLDYLEHSFFESSGQVPVASGQNESTGHSADAIVWACRGGGKTMLGAVATLLDLLFKPGIQVRILGGSFEQSEKMYAYLRWLVRRHFEHLLVGAPTQRRLLLTNGSRVEVLAQSDRSVRGQRVQKLRCDEVELFDPEVWQAAQLTTRSLGGASPVRGAVEAFSTMHRPGGLMQRIMSDCQLPIADCQSGEGEATGGRSAMGNRKSAMSRRIFAWCVWDVIERCPPNRSCTSCALWDACRGRAKRADGFMKIDDVLAMRSRVSQATWDHEMLCLPPRYEDAVFPAFRRERHVKAAPAEGRVCGNRLTLEGRPAEHIVESIICGVDFGYAQAFVCLWIAILRPGAWHGRLAHDGLQALSARTTEDPGASGIGLRPMIGEMPQRPLVWVFDEMVTGAQTVGRNAAAMRERSVAGAASAPAVVYCDVAGRHVNSQTGHSDERIVREAGFVTRSRAMAIDEGIDLIAELLDPALGEPRLLIDPKCVRLIEALEGYRRAASGRAEKDGRHDHLIDALRYALVNHCRESGKVEMRRY